jgi:hypothetical protein
MVQVKTVDVLELTTLERLFQKSKQGLFGVLFVMSHDTSENKYRAWFMVVFHALQVGGQLEIRCRGRLSSSKTCLFVLQVHAVCRHALGYD